MSLTFNRLTVFKIDGRVEYDSSNRCGCVNWYDCMREQRQADQCIKHVPLQEEIYIQDKFPEMRIER